MTKFATELARVMSMRNGYRLAPMMQLSVTTKEHEIDPGYQEVRFTAEFGALKVFPTHTLKNDIEFSLAKKDIIENVLYMVHGDTRKAIYDARIALSELGTKVPWSWLGDLLKALEEIDKTTRPS